MILIGILLAAGIAIHGSRIEYAPQLAPTAVLVSASFPGASAETVAETIAQPIEQEVSQLPDVTGTSSRSLDDGTYALTVNFELGTDADEAALRVQNRVALAVPRLPEEAQRGGVRTERGAPHLLLLAQLISSSSSWDEASLSNYAITQLKEPLEQVPGVGKVRVIGAEAPSMRIWLDPKKLRMRRLTSDDVVTAVREQNEPAAAGQLGAPPNLPDQLLQHTIKVPGRFSDVVQIEKVIVRARPTGDVVRVGDVARVESNACTGRASVEVNGQRPVAVAVYTAPDANPLEVAKGVRRRLEQLSQTFPHALRHSIVYDTSYPMREALWNTTAVLAIGLVAAALTLSAILWRLRVAVVAAAVMVATAVSTLAVLTLAGLSINVFTLLGLLVAFGIAIDEIVLVVENAKGEVDKESLPWESVEEKTSFGEATAAAKRALEIMEGEGLRGRQAVAKARRENRPPVPPPRPGRDMGWLRFSVKAIGGSLAMLVLLIPTTMLDGLVGRISREILLATALGAVFSAVYAAALGRVLCSRPLAKPPKEPGKLSQAATYLGSLANTACAAVVGFLVRQAPLAVVLFLGLLGATVAGILGLPRGFLPVEDQGYFLINVQLPPGSALPRTRQTLEKLEDVLRRMPVIDAVVSIAGYSALDDVTTSDAGTLIVVLDPWRERRAPQFQAASLVRYVQEELNALPQADCKAFLPPAIIGLGNADGFGLCLRRLPDEGPVTLQQAAERLLDEASAEPALTRLHSDLLPWTSQLGLQVDSVKAKQLGVAVPSVLRVFQASLGAIHATDFSRAGQAGKVVVRGDASMRNSIEEVGRMEVRARSGALIPIANLVSVRDTVGPRMLHRCDCSLVAMLRGTAAAGYSSGEAVDAVESAAWRSLPPSMEIQWAGPLGDHRIKEREWWTAVAVGMVLTYLILVLLLESWSLPLAVLLAAPLGLLGALVVIGCQGGDHNLYTQVGLVVLVGVSCKSATVTCQFAQRMRRAGRSISEAAAEAARHRLFAVLGTGGGMLAAWGGLVVVGGPGAAGQQALGMAVAGGAISSAGLGLVLVPVLFAVVQWGREWLAGEAELERIWSMPDLVSFTAYVTTRKRRRTEWASSDGLDSIRPGWIYTINGPIAPERLGMTLPHEHVLIDMHSAAESGRPSYQPESVLKRMIDVIGPLRTKGCRTLVDCTPANLGRDAKLLRQLAELTGLQVLTNTGYSGIGGGRFLPPHAIQTTAEELAHRWLAEVKRGIGNTRIRPGFIKIGVNAAPLSTLDANLVRAAARVHLATGLTIASFTPDAATAVEQLAILESEEVDPNAWIWCHAQVEPQTNSLLTVALRGAYLQLDDITADTIKSRVAFLLLLRERDLLDRVLISHNAQGYTVGLPRGGDVPRYDALFKLLIPGLFKAGFTLEQLEQLTVVNPMNAFTVRVRPLTRRS